jgi:hypothetical protein
MDSTTDHFTARIPATVSAFQTSQVLTTAVMLARAGIPVFPCAAGGKQPLTTHGFQDASSDAAQVTAWWRRWPDANLGMPTGRPSGVDVVDIDVHPAGSGFAAFERARAGGYVDGWAWLVRTPSGGVHAYFLRSESGVQRSWQVPKAHIDFRGDGGYIIVPPSRVTGEDGVTRSYQPIAVAEHHNPWSVDANGLRGFLDPPRPMRPPTDIPAVGAHPDKLAAWVASRPEGGRNGGLFWAACRMAEEGHDLSTTTSLLGEAAYAVGLPEREAIATIRSAYRIASRLGPANQPRPTQAVEAVGL